MKLEWNNPIEINTEFRLTKREQKFQEIKDQNCFDLIYFDAFGYRVQPELWSKEIFEKMYQSLKDGGVLVTYAAKGEVRRNMQAVGFTVERLPGPPGKREMLRATKNINLKLCAVDLVLQKVLMIFQRSFIFQWNLDIILLQVNKL